MALMFKIKKEVKVFYLLIDLIGHYTQCVSKSRAGRLRVKERSVYEIHEDRRPRKTTNPGI